MIYDAIVVGAGPGGALAAAKLAAARKSVLMVDRCSFPRDKACGDLLSPSALRLLRALKIDPHDYGVKFRLLKDGIIKDCAGTVHNSGEAFRDLVRVTCPRLEFDNMLYERAILRGVRFEVMDVAGPLFSARASTDDRESGPRVAGIVERRGRTTIEHEARVVIVANGASSSIARAIDPNFGKAAEIGLAIRAYGRLPKGALAVPLVDYRLIPKPGYGWVFPMVSEGTDEKVNIGVGVDHGTYKALGLNLRRHLTDFRELLHGELDIEIDPASVKSWPLPLFYSTESRARQGAFLVGDAGRFVDQYTGEGIFQAMLTGYLAGKYAVQVIDNTPLAYENFDKEWRFHLKSTLLPRNAI